MIVVDLQNPKEKYWGALLQITPAGLWLQGLNLATFEDWVRQFSADAYPIAHIGLSTAFFPMHRVERVTLDEAAGDIPSYFEQFAERAGSDAAPRIFRDGRTFDPITGVP